MSKTLILFCLVALTAMAWADVPASASATNKEEAAEQKSADHDLQADGSGHVYHPHHGIHPGIHSNGGHYYHHTSYGYGRHRHPLIWHGYYPIVHLGPRYHFHHEHLQGHHLGHHYKHHQYQYGHHY